LSAQRRKRIKSRAINVIAKLPPDYKFSSRLNLSQCQNIQQAIKENILKFSDSHKQRNDITFIVAAKEL